eukprot:m.27896 g.27896  ORF g.27896 m.27896 type:complete len:123 (+) comp7949_c0_seq1:158-526(+)
MASMLGRRVGNLHFATIRNKVVARNQSSLIKPLNHVSKSKTPPAANSLTPTVTNGKLFNHQQNSRGAHSSVSEGNWGSWDYNQLATGDWRMEIDEYDSQGCGKIEILINLDDRTKPYGLAVV